MSQYALPRNERLRSQKMIRRLFESGRRGFVYPFRYGWPELQPEAEGSSEGGMRLDSAAGVVESEVSEAVDAEDTAIAVTDSDSVSGREPAADGNSESCSTRIEVLFAVPKKFHRRANKRNLLRRRTKESYRLSNGGLKRAAEGRHLVMALIYSSKEVLSYKTVNHAVGRILEQVCRSL